MKEINLFEIEEKTILPPNNLSKNESNNSFQKKEKETSIFLINKGSMIYPEGKRKGILQDKEGLRCIKLENEKGKSIKNTTTGLTKFQALDHFHLYLDGEYRTHDSYSFFSTFSHLAKRTNLGKK